MDERWRLSGLIQLRPLIRISPSHFTFLKKCNLRSILASNQQDAFLPLNPQAILGTILHQLLDDANNGQIKTLEDFNNHLDLKIQRQDESLYSHWINKRHFPLSEKAYHFDIKVKKCWRTISQVILPNNEKSIMNEPYNTSPFGSEKWLESSDKIVGGYIDAIMHLDDKVAIVDFKTGKLLKEDGSGQINEEYKTQLKLYARLFFDEYGYWPDQLLIIDLDGKKHDISFTASECNALMEEARTLFNYINSKIQNKENDLKDMYLIFSSPDPDNCSYCQYRPICPNYWISRQQVPDPRWPNDVIGSIVEKVTLGNGLFHVRIKDRNTNVVSSIRGLNPDWHVVLREDDNDIAAMSLDGDLNMHSYKENRSTTIFAIDPNFVQEILS
ncbi:PD-(D/E)XK nuclease family protein [Methanocalculus sp.]|uniref:PD-(D/E)XK nuclease family protein n=1 Tax=Methanocalculus sp. TaxID=2004547 RepID=UPI0026131DE3|nr:PD-(D/E)XK nuclease family protein [Methanocalculus sp.]MDG6249759.1 PD-(D/E)XK nuclease family protein [Methanocalculus sp.]